MENKKYAITDDLSEVMDDVNSIEQTILFLSSQAGIKRKEFWEGVYKLYPGLNPNLRLRYSSSDSTVSVIEQEEK